MLIHDINQFLSSVTTNSNIHWTPYLVCLLIFELVASLLTFISFIPEIFHFIKTKKTSGTSMSMYIMFSIEYLMWVLYGFMLGVEADQGWVMAIGIIVCDTLGFLTSSFLLAYKMFKYYVAKSMNMTEEQYEKWCEKQKYINEKSKKLGYVDKKHQYYANKIRDYLINIIKTLMVHNKKIVIKRITTSKVFKEKIIKKPKTTAAILKSFLSIASNQQIADVVTIAASDIEHNK